MNMHVVSISAVVCLCLATVLGFLEFTDNEVKGSTSDRYELKPACATLLRAQVNSEMHASLVYMNMAAHFDQNGVARKGFAKLFKKNSEEEREHAQKLIDFLNVRGSKFAQFNIDMPDKTEWPSALDALKDAVLLENEVYNQLNHIHDVAEMHCKDAHLMDFLEREYFDEQVQAIDGLMRHVAELGVMADHVLGEYLYDKRLLAEKLEL